MLRARTDKKSCCWGSGKYFFEKR